MMRGLPHHYGELIIAHYNSGFTDRSVFGFDNLYLYGGLFDVARDAPSSLAAAARRSMVWVLLGCALGLDRTSWLLSGGRSSANVYA
jgi:hypothetical protein